MMNYLQISVTIESRLSGLASGHLVIHTDLSATVNSLILAFLTDKGANFSSNYVLRTGSDNVLDGLWTLAASNIVDGDVLYLTNRSAGDEMFGFNNWYIMALLAVIISITGLIAICMVYSTTGHIPRDYGIVFDAGSTHTTMEVYSWDGAKMNNTGEPKQTRACITKGGGIAMFVGREDELEDALRGCLNEAKAAIPGGKVSATPVYLGATGGMRLLDIKDHAAANKILQVVDNTFAISGFKYQSGMASIISGEDEATDAWVTSNYVMHTLTKVTPDSKLISTLDLGGASTQFAVEDGKNHTANETADLSLYGLPHEVFVRSYLCFGVVQSFTRLSAQLTVGWSNESVVIVDPCFPTGFNNTMSLQLVFDSPCTWMDSSLRPKLDPTTNVTFIGSSSSTNCSRQVQALFNNTDCSSHYKYQQCFINETLAQNETPFLAISSFYYVMQFLNLTQPTIEEFLDIVTKVCEQPWPQVQYLYRPNVGGSKTAPQYYCFQGLYVYHLLTTGYNFSNETWKNLHFADSVNGTDLGWSMGFMINATNGIAVEVAAQPIALPVFVGLIVLFAVFLLLALAFVCHAWRQKREPAPYQRLSQYGAI